MKKIMKFATGILTGLLSAALLLSCSGKKASAGTTEKLTKVNMVSPTAIASLDLCWLYAADGLGLFEKEGIKLNLIECTDGSDPKMLASGQADFGGFSPSVGLSSVEAGTTNVRGIVNTVCCNMFGFAYNKASGIKTLKDIEGKNIASLADSFYVLFNPILVAAGVDISTVKYITYGSAEYEALDRNQVPAMGTWLSEYYMCQGMGYDWGYLSGDDVLPQIANSLWVNTDYAAKNPEIVKKFAKTIQESIYICYKAPEIVADLVLTRYPSIEITWEGAVGSVKGNVAGMLGMDEASRDAIVASKKIGYYDMAIVEQTIQNLVVGGALSKPLDAATYYTNEYLTTDIDFEAIDKILDTYEYQSKIYKASH